LTGSGAGPYHGLVSPFLPRRLLLGRAGAGLAGLAAAAGLLAALVPRAAAQAPPLPTSPPATDVPATSPPATQPPPTAPPATAPPPAPPTAPPARPPADDDDEPGPAAATAGPALIQGSLATPSVTRTRRPTRTPRTSPTPTATAAVAGSLRLTVFPLSLGPEGAAFRVAVENRDVVAADGVTLAITLPAGRGPGEPVAQSGQAFLDGPTAYWYLPHLEPAAGSELRVPLGVVPGPGETVRVCVGLLSAASPLEHCTALGGPGAAVAAPALVLGGAGALGPEDGATVPDAPPAGPAVLPPVLGWGLVLLGLGVLGAWLGLRLRPPAPASGAGPEPPAAG
jgi:hypothetical protein